MPIRGAVIALSYPHQMFRRSPLADDPRRRLTRAAAVLLAWLAMGSGCLFDNGLPADLLTLLAARGLQPQVLSQQASVRSRAAHLVLLRDAALERRIVASFGLAPVSQPVLEVEQAIAAAAITPAAVLGITGRPAVLKLANGAQLEYLYLVTTASGNRSWLFAAYAYG